MLCTTGCSRKIQLLVLIMLNTLTKFSRPYTTNMIDAVLEARKKKPFNSNIDMWAIQIMAQLYVYYYQTVARAPQFAEQNLNSCIEYYTKVFRDMQSRFTDENFNDIFSQVLQQQGTWYDRSYP